MNLNSFYPVLCTDHPVAVAEFYKKNFDFDAVFETDWYISLKSRRNPSYELALLDRNHPSLPEPYRQTVQGLLLNYEVPNVDREYQRLKVLDVPIVLDIRSEDWGQRHFILEGPDRVLIDVIQPIEPSGEFA